MVILMILIDMHTHILPYIDDGAKSLSEAYEMIESLYSQNTIEAVCTPHFNPVTMKLDEFVYKRNESYKLIQDSKVNLVYGSETELSEYLFYYSELYDLCFGDTNYLLIELPLMKRWSKKVYGMIDKLIQYYDIIPIIAHIERYEPTKKNKKLIKKLQNKGCLIQVNTSTLLNEKTKERMLHFIKENYVDVLGSDCHNMSNRKPILYEAYHMIQMELGEEYCKSLVYNAWCILRGVDIRNSSFIEDELKEEFLKQYNQQGPDMDVAKQKIN